MTTTYGKRSHPHILSKPMDTEKLIMFALINVIKRNSLSFDGSWEDLELVFYDAFITSHFTNIPTEKINFTIPWKLKMTDSHLSRSMEILNDHSHHYLLYGLVDDKVIDAFEQKVKEKTEFYDYIKFISD